MQTFLPYDSFKKSLECLDYKRLGKQRVEARQIYDTLKGKSKGWRNHPMVKMWKGYENALALYHNIAIDTWKERGYNNNMKKLPIRGAIVYPHWFGNKKFHASHRSNLLRKKPEFYSRYGWEEPSNLPYVWFVQ